METLTFSADYGATASYEPQIIKNSFGDGYEQTRPKGLNFNLRHYAVSFTGTEQKIKSIDTFLQRHGGYKAFLWQPYGTKQGKFKCEKWQVSEKVGFFTLTAEFREVV